MAELTVHRGKVGNGTVAEIAFAPLEQTLQNKLAALQSAAQVRREDVGTQQSRLSMQLTAVESQVATLTAEQYHLRSALAEATERLVTLESEFAKEQLRLCMDTFTAQAEQLLEYVRSLRERDTLLSKRHALLAITPELAKQLAEYQSVEQQWSHLQAQLPTEYLAALCVVQDDKRAKIEPLLGLDGALARLEDAMDSLHLDVVVCIDTVHSAVSVSLPIVAEHRDQFGLAQETIDQFMEATHEACLDLAMQPALAAVEVEPCIWHGFASVQLQLEPGTNPQSVEDPLCHLLQRRLAPLIMPGGKLNVSVVDVPYAVWTLDLHAPASLQDLLGLVPSDEQAFAIPDPSEPPLPAEADMTEPETASPGRFFSPADYRSWTRQVRVVPGSNWNVDARRARTLSMRLVAKGFVGTRQIAESEVVAGLPRNHTTAMSRVIERMAEHSVLLTDERNPSVRLVSLNPRHLAEIEELINRTLSPFWEAVLTS